MGRNLTGKTISSTYEGLVQISGSLLTDGTGSLIPSLEVTASHALTADSSISASYAQTSTSASHALVADLATTASYVESVISASYATSASWIDYNAQAFAEMYIDTSNNTVSLYRPDGSSSTATIYSASYAVSSSHAEKSNQVAVQNNVQNFAYNLLVSTPGYNTPQSATNITVNPSASSITATTFNGNATTATSASYALTASYAENGGGGAAFPFTGSAEISGSLAVTNVGSTAANISLKGGYIHVNSDSYNEFAGLEVGHGNTLNKPAGNTNTIFGVGNTNNSANGGFVHGENNTINGPSYGSVIIGSYGGSVNGSFSGLFAGQSNTVNGHNNSVVIGGQNLTTTAADQVVVPTLLVSGSGGGVQFPDGTTQTTAAGPAFPYTGSAQITGSFAVTGSQYGLLTDNENIEIYQNVTVGNVTPNIVIGGRVGAFDTNGKNNILIGSSQNGQTDSSVNRYIGVTGTNYSNIIAGGLGNYISGSGGSRTINTIIGGNGNTIGKEDWVTNIVNNSIVGGYFHDIFAGSYNFLGGGSSQNIYTGSLDSTPSYNAFIGGGSHDIFGGDYNAFVGGYNSQITDAKQSVIVGGENHTITQTGTFLDFDSVIVGGRNNTITDHARSVILGGDGLTTTKNDEVVVPNLTISGSGNVLTFADGTIQTTAAGGAAFPYTGSAQITGSLAVTGSATIGASSNTTAGAYSVVLGGTSNTLASNDNSMIVGGNNNNISATSAPMIGIIGGNSNSITTKHNGKGYGTIIVGGSGNTIGGSSDSIANYGAAIVGANTAENNAYFSGVYSTAAPGGIVSKIRYGADVNNGIEGSTILGGANQEISGLGLYASLVGGYGNKVQQKASTIVGGYNNSITDAGTSAGGAYTGSVIVGGHNNLINQKNNSVILGGSNITASANNTTYVPHLDISGSATGNVYTLTDVAGTTTMDCRLGNFFTLAMPAGGSTTLTPTNIQAGQTINVKITQNATPSTIAFAGTVEFEGGTAFAVSTGAGEVDVMTFVSFDGTSLQATGIKNFS